MVDDAAGGYASAGAEGEGPAAAEEGAFAGAAAVATSAARATTALDDGGSDAPTGTEKKSGAGTEPPRASSLPGTATARFSKLFMARSRTAADVSSLRTRARGFFRRGGGRASAGTVATNASYASSALFNSQSASSDASSDAASAGFSLEDDAAATAEDSARSSPRASSSKPISTTRIRVAVASARANASAPPSRDAASATARASASGDAGASRHQTADADASGRSASTNALAPLVATSRAPKTMSRAAGSPIGNRSSIAPPGTSRTASALSHSTSAHTSPNFRTTPNSNLRGLVCLVGSSRVSIAPGAFEGGGTAGRSVAATRVTGVLPSSSSHVSATHSLRPGRAAMSHSPAPFFRSDPDPDPDPASSRLTASAARAWKQAPNGPMRGLAPSLGRTPDATASTNAASAVLTASASPAASNDACAIGLPVSYTLVDAAVVKSSVGVMQRGGGGFDPANEGESS